MTSQKLRFELAGEYYGYPKCCIAFCIKKHESHYFKKIELTLDQRSYSNNSGFVPCPACIDKLKATGQPIESLIKDRVCKSAFPDGGSTETLNEYIDMNLPDPHLKIIGPPKPEWQSLYDIMQSDAYQKFVHTQTVLQHELERAQNDFQRLQAFAKYYKANEADIIEAHEHAPHRWFSSYPCDWIRFQTHIERDAWLSIRAKGRIILYPQYPALNYYLDFANPGEKIALELDGKAYHNKERDFIRDTELKANGWTVYRITGSEMVKKDYLQWTEIYNLDNEDEQIDAIRYWIINTGDGIIEAIKQVHFIGCNEVAISQNCLYSYFYQACEQTLELHKS